MLFDKVCLFLICDFIEELEQMGELTQERIDEEIENLLSQNPREDFVGVKLFVLSQTL